MNRNEFTVLFWAATACLGFWQPPLVYFMKWEDVKIQAVAIFFLTLFFSFSQPLSAFTVSAYT